MSLCSSLWIHTMLKSLSSSPDWKRMSWPRHTCIVAMILHVSWSKTFIFIFISYFSGTKSDSQLLPGYLPLIFPLPLDMNRRTLHSRRREATRLMTGRQLLKLFLSFQQGIHMVPIQRRKMLWSWWMIHICWNGKPTSINAVVHEF